MRKAIQQARVGRLLIVGLIGAAMGSRGGTSQPADAAPGDASERMTTSQAASAPKASDSEFEYTASELRDPMKSLLPGQSQEAAVKAQSMAAAQRVQPAPPPQPPAMTLQGLVWSGPRSLAVIQGDVYGIGDTVQGATILDIDRDGVLLEFQHLQFRLLLNVPSGPGAATPGDAIMAARQLGGMR